MTLKFVDFAVIVVYLLTISGISVYWSKRQTNREEYFLGSRNVHWLLAGGSILASLISSASFLTVPGEMIQFGVSYLVGIAVLPLVIPVVTHFLLPVIHALPITTAYEYLEKRFGPGVKRLGEVLFVLRVSLWMAIIVYTASLAIVEVTSWPFYPTILLVGIVTSFYTAVGGFQTVVWTDNVQMIVMLAGIFGIPLVIWTMTQTGPGEWWTIFSQAGRTKIQVFSFDPTVRMTLFAVILSQFFWNICLNASDQVVVQRYLSTPALAPARKSVWVATILQMVVVASLAFCGLALFAGYWLSSGLQVQEFQNQLAPQADRLLPRFIGAELPPGISGLLLGALLAAAMSSLSSGINSVSSVVSGYFSREGNGHKGGSALRTEKMVAFGCGAFVTGAAAILAFVITRTGWNLLEMSTRVGGLLLGPLAVLFFGGMLFHWTGREAVLIGFSVSLASSAFIAFGSEIFGLQNRISFLWVVPFPVIVGVICTGLVGRWLPRPSELQVQGLAFGRMLSKQRPQKISTTL
jgi:SSS family solute:Na+ symporter